MSHNRAPGESVWEQRRPRRAGQGSRTPAGARADKGTWLSGEGGLWVIAHFARGRVSALQPVPNSEEDTGRINAYLALMGCWARRCLPRCGMPRLGEQSTQGEQLESGGRGWPGGATRWVRGFPEHSASIPQVSSSPFCSPSFATPSGQITSHAPLTLVAIEQPRRSCFPLVLSFLICTMG